MAYITSVNNTPFFQNQPVETALKVIETPLFTQRIYQVMRDDEYRELQNVLIENPTLGKIIPKSGGIRKLRWKGSGRGKRGGSRVIYYWITREETLLMLYLYKKADQKDLTPERIKRLRTLVHQEIKTGD